MAYPDLLSSSSSSPAPRSAPGSGRRFDLPVLARQATRDLTYLGYGFLTGTVFLSLAVILVSLSLGLLVVVIGIPLAIASSRVVGRCADVERRLALVVDPVPIRRDDYRELPSGLLPSARAMLRDPRRGRDLAYLLVQYPVSLLGVCVASLWVGVAMYVAYPLFFWALPSGFDGPFGIPGLQVHDLPEALLVCALGVALAPVVFWACRRVVLLRVGLTRAMLGDRAA